VELVVFEEFILRRTPAASPGPRGTGSSERGSRDALALGKEGRVFAVMDEPSVAPDRAVALVDGAAVSSTPSLQARSAILPCTIARTSSSSRATRDPTSGR
jgi:hypothetical protein